MELNALGRVLAMPEVLDDEGNPVEPDEPVEVYHDIVVIDCWYLLIIDALSCGSCPCGA